MNDARVEAAAAVAPGGGSRGLWRRRAVQAAAVFRLEIRRLLRAPGILGLAGLAALPAFPFAILALVRREETLAFATENFAHVFQGFAVPMAIFFGCVVVFTGLVRREQRERTLHLLLLTPVRREIVLAGKYAAGLVATSLLFAGGILAAFALAYAPFLSSDAYGLQRFFLAGPGFNHLGAYLAVTLLGCVGYGAVFLALGLVFRSPIVPALIVFGWEAIHGLLPPLLKKLSVFTYLHALCPVPVSSGPFALLAEAPSPWVAVPGLLILAAGLIAISLLKFRSIEVQYGEE